jgi:hypothetical protein
LLAALIVRGLPARDLMVAAALCQRLEEMAKEKETSA